MAYSYSIDIDCTAYTVASATSMGLVSGVFKWTTGDTSGAYTGGIIVDESMDSIERSVDISETGGFFTDGSAGVSIAGALNMQDTIDAYMIKIVGCHVTIKQGDYVVFNGIVVGTSESEYNFNLSFGIDDSVLSKIVPPTLTSDGDVVPVVFGTVAKSPCANIIDISEPWIAHDDGGVDTDVLLVTGITDNYSTSGITKVQFYFDSALNVFENYQSLFVTYSPLPNVPRRLVVKITQNDSYYTAYATDYSVVGPYYIELDVYAKLSDIVVYTGSNILTCTTMQIFEFSKECQISNTAIGSPTVFNDLNIYEEISSNYQQIFGALSSYDNPNFILFAGKTSQNTVGNSVVSIALNAQWGQSGSAATYTTQTDMMNVFDRSKSTYGYFSVNTNQGLGGHSYLFSIGQIRKEDIKYDGDYYFCYDWSVIENANIYRLRCVQVKLVGVDIYNNISDLATIGNGSDTIFSFEYGKYSENVLATYYTTPKSVDTIYNSIQSPSDVMKIPDAVITAMKSGVIKYCHLEFNCNAYSEQTFDGVVKLMKWYGGCVICVTPVGVEKDIIYADIESGELYGTDPTTVLETAVNHLAATYGTSNEIAFPNTGVNEWGVGKTITETTRIKDAIDILAKSAMSAVMFSSDGSLSFVDWLNSPTSTIVAFSETNILRDSISEWRMSSVDKAYNDFTISYDYDYASGEYAKTIRITNTDQAAFPDITGNWTEYVSGIGTSEAAYWEAKTAWEYAHAGYLATGLVCRMPAEMGQCPWFVDNTWAGGSGGVNLSAWKFAKACAYWLPMPKYETTFQVSRSIFNTSIDLVSYCTLSDAVYTSSQPVGGYITSMSAGLDSVQIKMMMVPVYEMRDTIIETGSAATDIQETGSQTDDIDEGA